METEFALLYMNIQLDILTMIFALFAGKLSYETSMDYLSFWSVKLLFFFYTYEEEMMICCSYFQTTPCPLPLKREPSVQKFGG